MVVCPTHARGGAIDLLMTDVPDLVRADIINIGNSDHSSQSVVISMAQAEPNLCVSRKNFLKHKMNLNTVCGAIYPNISPGVTIGLLTILLMF